MWTVALVLGLVALALFLLSAVSAWVLFDKANKPGWAALVPVYNLIVLLRDRGTTAVVADLDVHPGCERGDLRARRTRSRARAFGKGTGFALGLVFLTALFVRLLAFGSAQYCGPLTA